MKSKKTVLVVEDEEYLRDALKDILHLNNFLALVAKNGEEGLELAISKQPDLILLDLIMPKMDGMATLALIRKNNWGASVPVIILTNVSATSEQLVEGMLKHRPLHYLVKSDWKIHDVLKKIEEILGEN